MVDLDFKGDKIKFGELFFNERERKREREREREYNILDATE